MFKLLIRSTFRLVYTRSASTHQSNASVRTALYDFHIRNGAKIVNFGGYDLPVQYANLSITASHLHTRRIGSIFDVSHMLQTIIKGKDAIAVFECICTADLVNTPIGSGTLTVFTNDDGGILDDLIVTKVSDDELYVVSNAAMKAQDMNIMTEAVLNAQTQGKDVRIEFLATAQQSLVAVQGPAVVPNVTKLLPKDKDLSKLYFMQTMSTELAGIPDCRITRCGYTGEDGFEISVRSGHVEQLTEALLSAGKTEHEQLQLAGLGARDSLRLEAGLCLYGHDIDAQTTPIEAGLAWLVAKRRRAAADFKGAHVILAQLKNGVTRRRVGLEMLGSKVPTARANVEIFQGNEVIGRITSGCPSPSLNKNIAMGYIAENAKAPGTKVQLKIRDKFYEAQLVKMPFVKPNYYVKAK